MSLVYSPEEDVPEGTPSWSLLPLYKLDQKGDKVLTWSVGFDLDESRLEIQHGYVGGSLQTDYHAVKRNKTGRSLTEQAQIAARKRFKDKVRDGYVEDPSGETLVFLPQLANKWNWEGPDHKPRALGKSHFDEGRVLAQIKLDGMRGYATLEGDRVVLRYRKGDTIPWLNHIKDELEILFTYLPQGTVVDGELTVHNEDDSVIFRQILNSIVRSFSVKHPDNERVVFNIFDIYLPDSVIPQKDGGSLDERLLTIRTAFEHYEADPKSTEGILELIPMVPMGSSEELKDYYEKVLEEGHEGLIVRKLAGKNPTATKRKESLYTHSRNNNMLKIKPFEDEEGEILEIDSAEGRDKGTAIFTMRAPNGAEFKLRPVGTLAQRREYYENPDKYIGKLYTYRFRGRSKTGVPQHPTGEGFRIDL